MGQEAEADIVVRLDGGFDIGFRSEGQNVTMVADVWGLKIDREHFMRQLLQRYAYLTVMEQSRQNGWAAIEEEVQSDGSIRLVMQRWA
jgi:hypothetical protein